MYLFHIVKTSYLTGPPLLSLAATKSVAWVKYSFLATSLYTFQYWNYLNILALTCRKLCDFFLYRSEFFYFEFNVEVQIGTLKKNHTYFSLHSSLFVDHLANELILRLRSVANRFRTPNLPLTDGATAAVQYDIGHSWSLNEHDPPDIKCVS